MNGIGFTLKVKKIILGKKIKLHSPTFGPEEITSFAHQMITTNVTMGTKVSDFEKKFSKMFSFKHSITSNSGSSANLLMVAALRNRNTKNHLKEKDEVIIPALTWSTSLFPLLQYGLTPVFVDCDLDTLNIDINQIESAIGPKTRDYSLLMFMEIHAIWMT